MSVDYNDINKWKSMVKQTLGQDFLSDIFPSAPYGTTSLIYDIYKNTSEIIVLVNLPYITELAKIKLSVQDKELIIKGKIDLGYDHLETVESNIIKGDFEQVISLPDLVNTNKVNAQYQRGILKIQLFPKLRKEGSSIRIKEL
jgi:HSP20 family molecular chaperone IbpA